MTHVVVVGGGPAGLATAIGAAMAGFAATVIEPKNGVIDKACGEGIMPLGVRRLTSLGVEPEPRFHFPGIRYISGKQMAEARFGTGPGWGIRRTVLHQALLARADELGVEHRHQRVTSVTQTAAAVQIQTDTSELEADWLIAADGLRSPIRRNLGLDLPARRPPRTGLRRHYQVAPWSDHVEVHWSPVSEAYITPEASDLIGLAILTDPAGLAAHPVDGRPVYDRLMDDFPALKARLGEPCTAVRGAGPFEVRAKRHVEGRIFLVGDASGFVDPLTGEGITLGLGCADAAIRAIQQQRPQQYEADWWRITRNYRWLTEGLVRLAQNRLTRRLVVPGARHLPGVMNLAVRRIGD